MAQFYKDAGDKRDFEVVLIGYDENQKAHEKYMKKSKMEWAGLKMSAKGAIVSKLVPKTAFLPSMVMMDPAGKVVAGDTQAVMKKLKAMTKKP